MGQLKVKNLKQVGAGAPQLGGGKYIRNKTKWSILGSDAPLNWLLNDCWLIAWRFEPKRCIENTLTWTDGHTGSEPKRPVETKKNVFTFVLQSVSGMANCTAAGTSLLTYTGLTYIHLIIQRKNKHCSWKFLKKCVDGKMGIYGRTWREVAEDPRFRVMCFHYYNITYQAFICQPRDVTRL